MSPEMRWRVVTLQIVLILLLAFGAGIGLWAHNFTHDQVGSQLSGQQIVFPTATNSAITALPKADAAAMAQAAGQTMTTGYQAQTYAEHFIRVHLGIIGKGQTYDYYSGKSIAEATTNPTLSAADNATALTLFRGDTLRALLDQAYAFWFIGDIALYAAIGLIVATCVVFVSLLFELFVAPKQHAARLLARAA